ncbi:putative glycolate dehydrogenase, 2-subunit type [Candidatus Syntrophocurvum alkaliphilum]|uniref:Putative glycolate dehydrogenase, 2-subunit type n=1 Tax=Candidatus Syntrophocurvum alkaliphilum TaxID=2293317 RepID=A0A6I6D991_9FIRM|nr:FAD-binding oxidoreductase [Candidatus Syntrophocurvum alkaliphilum]QGT99415.1 putative glycolate dehydrogenase, 2-subunit type [Candidatus Syntrophocurvum alkaliphilum]
MEKTNLKSDLISISGKENVLTDDLDLMYYSYDSSFLTKIEIKNPDAVVLPKSTEEVQQIMKYAFENNIPVVPRGAGTGETGGCVALNGGIIIDLSTWDDIVEIDNKNMQVILRPGVIHAELNKELAKYNLFFPPDPGSSQMCTVGGMVANNASGLRAVKYGCTEQYILGLEVVLPNGEIITTGGMKSKAIKNVSGLNMTKLMVGSEGVLGIVTKIRLRCWPKPKARGIAMAVYDKLDDAPASVLEVYQAGILPSGIEILDSSAIEAVNQFKPEINLPDAEAILLFEVDGNPPGVEYEGNTIKEVTQQRARYVEWATDTKRMAELWEGRSVTAAAAARVRPDGSRIFAGEDVSVPLSKVADTLRAIRDLGEKYNIKVVNYGHIGDGNVHTAPVINPENPDEVERVKKLVHEIHLLAIELEGSTTGEHGVGAVRREYAELEHGNAVNYMRKIKEAFDSKGIMNPEKLF